MIDKPKPLKNKVFELDPRASAEEGSAFWLKDVKSACEFWLRYKDNPELLVKEQNYFSNYWELFERFKYQNYDFRWEFDNKKYNEWLFRLAFQDVMENVYKEMELNSPPNR